MSKLIVNHAAETVWCSPRQDRQHTIQLARITQGSGVIAHTRIMREIVRMPDPENGERRYSHVYQIGQYPPELLDLELQSEVWYRSDTLMEDQELYIQTFLGNGTVIAPSMVYIQLSRKKNLVVAIRLRANHSLGVLTQTNDDSGKATVVPATLNNQDAYIRFYSNALFDQPAFRSEAITENGYGLIKPIYALAQYGSTGATNTLGTLKTWLTRFANQPGELGSALCYLNGFIVEPVAITDDLLKDKHCTFIWDASLRKQFFDFVLADTPTYESKLDRFKSKYILLTDSEYDTFDFYDDLEFFLLPVLGNGTSFDDRKGVIIPRLDVTTIRNLTHNAYAVTTQVIDQLIDQHEFLRNKPLDQLKIQIRARKGGRAQGLIHPFTRVDELLKLGREEALNVMTGVNSYVADWDAKELERSAYMTLASTKNRYDITSDLVEKAYGYYLLSKTFFPVIHLPVTEPVNGEPTQYLDLEPAFQLTDPNINSPMRSIFLYVDGQYDDVFNDTTNNHRVALGQTYLDRNLDKIEVFRAEASDRFDGVLYDQDVKRSDLATYGFRAFVSTSDAQLRPVEDWQDVTDTVYYTYYPNGREGDGISEVVWNWNLLDQAKLFPAIRIHKYVTMFRPDLFVSINNQNHRSVDGMLLVALNTRVTWFGTTTTRIQTIAPGNLDVFLNGQSLVDGIDYHLDWPYICIVKRFNTPLEQTQVIIRTYGSGDPETNTPFKPREVGFVRQKLLSGDGKLQPTRHRMSRIVSGGKLYREDEVAYLEDYQSGQSVVSQLQDGRPYSLTDYVVPVEPISDASTIEYYQRSVTMDQSVENYLTQAYDEPETLNAVIEDYKWDLYSPVCALLLDMFEDGYLEVETQEHWSSAQAEQWLAPVNHLFKFDPCLKDMDLNYVDIFTHGDDRVVEITQGQYRFLEYVIRNHLNNLVDPTPTVTIKIN